jgi:tripartite-type tricarboxylate transporter receptor subunit TctC
MRRRPIIAGASAMVLAGNLPAQAAYPSRPLRYIVPVAAGGGSDLVGRTVCERWSRLLGQTIVVDNIGGGGGAIAATTTAHAAPDGYTLMQGYVATHATSPATRRLAYDPVRDFTPIGMIGGTPNVLVVSPSLKLSTLDAFVAHLRSHPGQLSYGSSGVGSLTQLAFELFKQTSRTFVVHVPYRGIAPAINDVLAGQTQAMFPGLAAALPFIKSGQLIPLAVTGSQRHRLLPQVPTLVESGYQDMDSVQWYGVVGPAGMAPATVRQLNETLAAVLGAADLRDKLLSEALEPMPMSPTQFAAYMAADLARWTRVARERGIQADS